MHGLQTLNRLLGKKNKEASGSTTNLSKSTSTSTSNLDSSSQYNKISPIVNNAPFEQTFRVTVYLPKNQLYVERIGAKTKLETLLNSICEKKDLTFDKYEFRHPSDMSQAFDIAKTIGEIGLNEMKLVLKTESRYSNNFHRFHADDVMTYKSNVPDSVSSEENSRNYKKNSPYSSTTSLNSLDSTGMNLTTKPQPPVAPARKKRAAPRPPSQNSIPEQEIYSSNLNVFKESSPSALPKKNFHVSSPQLFQSDTNNNTIETGNRLNAITRPTSLFVTSTTEIDGINGDDRRRERSPSESSEVQNILRNRNNSGSYERKKKPAPSPPKRTKPVPSPRTVQDIELKTPTISEAEEVEHSPKKDNNGNHESMLNVSKTLLNNHHHHESSTTDEIPSLDTVSTSEGPISIHISSSNESSLEHESKLPAVSKVHIKPDNRQSSSEEDDMTVNIYNVTKSIVTLEKQKIVSKNDDGMGKREEVGIASREEIIVMREKFVENSKSENVTVVVDEVRKSSSPPEEVFLKCQVKSKIAEEEKTVPRATATEVATMVEKERSLSPVWTYTLPAPPVFADRNEPVSPTDRHNGKFYSDIISTDCHETTTVLSDNTTIISAETHIHPVIVERKPIENAFIKSTSCDNESEKSTEIITSDLEDGYLGNKRTVKLASPSPVAEIESHSKKVEKEVIIDDFKTSRLLITRSDSFHTVELPREGPYSPPKRSTSFLSMQRSELSLNRAEKIDNSPYNRRKSSSELSISDTPSLQSLEIIKNILNSSRKNSTQDVGVLVREELREEPEIESMIEREETVKQELKIVSKKLETEFVDESLKLNSTMKIEEEKVVEVAKATEIEPTTTIIEEKIATKSPEIVESVKSEIENHKADVVAVKLETETVEQSEDAPKQTEAEVMKRETTTSSIESIKVEQSHHKPEIVAEKPKQVSEPPKQEKQWKYSGPPKINFSTWNERPKVEVAIADDNDYKRSGTISPTPKEHKENNKRHTIHFGAEKIKVQTAKPRVLGVELKKEPVAVVVASTENVNKASKTVINLKPRPINSDLNKSPTSPDFAYNNFIHNAKKFSPIVHGFNSSSNSNNNVAEKPVERKLSPTNHTPNRIEVERKSVEPPVVPLKPSFLRSSSESVAKKNIRFSMVEEPINEVGFSQNSLKRTGLKDKILTDDQKKESIFGRVVEEMATKQQAINSQNSRPISIPPPPKAPPMMMTKNNNNFKKSVSMNEAMDRNQLLDAIKNFNRDCLRHK